MKTTNAALELQTLFQLCTLPIVYSKYETNCSLPFVVTPYPLCTYLTRTWFLPDR